MNGSVSRRVFVGSLAGAGVGALGASSVDLSLSAQRTATSPLLVEIGEQLKDALGRMRSGQANGARQAATVLRVYASTVNNGQLQALLRKANRQQLLLTEMNHGELVRQAKELGIDPSRLPPHSVDRVGREAALDRLIKEGVSPFMRTVADYVDGVAEKMERLERRSGGAVALQIALRQPIPDQVDCGNCNQEQQQVETTLNIATVACAASLIFPFLAEACAAATATYLAFYSAFAICQAIVAFCKAYYN
jgi:hypothetical protein